MKFIKLNCWGDKSYTFALDFVVLINQNGRDTMFRLVDGQQIIFEMDYEELISIIFSDQSGDDKEYQLIEIDYTNPEPAEKPKQPKVR
jgi:hypothetical protein